MSSSPAVRAAKAKGIVCDGPYPADTVFVRARAGQFDAVLTMFHDQGQIAMKLIGFDKGVTLLGGFPMPITTPAHGTAYDIAGQGHRQHRRQPQRACCWPPRWDAGLRRRRAPCRASASPKRARRCGSRPCPRPPDDAGAGQRCRSSMRITTSGMSGATIILAARRADDSVPIRQLRVPAPQLPAGRLPGRIETLRCRTTVYVEAEWDPAIRSARRAGCTRWPRGRGCPTPSLRRPGSIGRMWQRCWRSRPHFPCAQRPPQAACRDRGRGAARSARIDGLCDLARRALPGSSGTVCISICRRRGGTSRRRPRSRAIFRAPLIIINHTGLPADRTGRHRRVARRSRAGGAPSPTPCSRSRAWACQARLGRWR